MAHHRIKSRHVRSWRLLADSTQGPKGRIPRDPPQRDCGNRGRALIHVGGEARDAAMSRVSEQLDLQSVKGRVVGVEEETPHHQAPNARGHTLGALGALMGSSSEWGNSVGVNAEWEAVQASRGRSWGLPGLITKFPQGVMRLLDTSRSFSVKVPCSWILSLSETPRW